MVRDNRSSGRNYRSSRNRAGSRAAYESTHGSRAAGNEPMTQRGSYASSRRSSRPATQPTGSRSRSRGYNAQHSATSADASQYSRSAGQYHARKNGRGKKVALAVACVLLVALVGCGIAGAMWYSNLSNTIKGDDSITNISEEENGKPYYVLLLGGDSREDSKDDNRTDSIMVCRVDESSQKVSMLSVPRDLRINIEGHGYCKINSAIEYGGYDQVITEVNELLGIKISYYAFIYFDGFEDLVDKLGGVTVEVPEGTYYNGVTVPAGDAVEINGQEALTLARCRHGNPPDQGAYAMGDYQRTLNQRNLMKAIAKKILAQDVTEYPSLIEGLASCVETNMDVSKIVSLASNMKGMDTDSLSAYQLPIAGDTVGGEWFAAMYDDVFQVVRSNFVNGRELDKGLDDFDTENNDNDLTMYCVDGELYAYCNYADIYGGTFTVND